MADFVDIMLTSKFSGPFQDALDAFIALERPFRWYGTFFTNAIPW